MFGIGICQLASAHFDMDISVEAGIAGKFINVALLSLQVTSNVKLYFRLRPNKQEITRMIIF